MYQAKDAITFFIYCEPLNPLIDIHQVSIAYDDSPDNIKLPVKEDDWHNIYGYFASFNIYLDKNNLIYVVMQEVSLSGRVKSDKAEVHIFSTQGEAIERYILITSSCTSDKSSNLLTITIDPSATSALYLSEVVDDYFYIPLQTHDDAFITNIRKIAFTKDKTTVIKDARDDSQLQFQFDGIYHASLNRQGKSSEEYIGIQDFVVQSDSVVVMITNCKRFFYY